MKKVLYLTTVGSTINAFLIPHIKMLIEDGYKVDCASFFNQNFNKDLMDINVNMYDIPFDRNPLKIRNVTAYKMLLKIQDENKYDIIHAHTPTAGIAGRLLKIRFPSLKIIYTAHGYHFLRNGNKIGWLIYYPIEKIMSRFTDVIININKEDFEITKIKMNAKKCFLINGVGIDLSKYRRISIEEQQEKRRELGLKKESFVILMIAEFNKNKNHIQLINALELLKDKNYDIKVLLVGEGPKLKELKKLVKLKGLSEEIYFLGFRNDINELINICNIGTLLSYREGLPRSIMEFMANGKKVIATDVRGNKDLVVNDNIGELVKISDYRETAKKIEKYYLKNKEEIQKSKFNFNNINVFENSIEIKPYDIKNVLKSLKKIYIDLVEE